MGYRSSLRNLPIKLDLEDHGYGNATTDELEQAQLTVKRPLVTNPLLRACPSCGARKGQRCRTVGKKPKPKSLARSSPIVHATRLQGTTAP